MASRQGRIRCRGGRISVDEGFAVSSGLLDLVVVLVNDVEEHRLEDEERRRRERRNIISGEVERGRHSERWRWGWGGGVSSSLGCFCVKRLLSSSPAPPRSLGASNTGGTTARGCGAGVGRMLINGWETERRSIKHMQSH